jgi:hypothetical protein
MYRPASCRRSCFFVFTRERIELVGCQSGSDEDGNETGSSHQSKFHDFLINETRRLSPAQNNKKIWQSSSSGTLPRAKDDPGCCMPRRGEPEKAASAFRCRRDYLYRFAQSTVVTTTGAGHSAVQIDPEYRTRIKTYVTEHKVRPVATQQKIIVGGAVPRDVELEAMSSDWAPRSPNTVTSTRVIT